MHQHFGKAVCVRCMCASEGDCTVVTSTVVLRKNGPTIAQLMTPTTCNMPQESVFVLSYLQYFKNTSMSCMLLQC